MGNTFPWNNGAVSRRYDDYSNVIMVLNPLVRGQDPTPETLRAVVEEDEDVEPLEGQVGRGVSELQEQLRDHGNAVDGVRVVAVSGQGLGRAGNL